MLRKMVNNRYNIVQSNAHDDTAVYRLIRTSLETYCTIQYTNSLPATVLCICFMRTRTL